MVPDHTAAHGHEFGRVRSDWIGHACVWAGVLIAVAYVALGVFADHWLTTLTPFPVTDDFRIYYDACLRALRGDNPYEPYLVGKSFLYHPAALTFVSLFAWLPGFALARAVWVAIGTLAYGASIALVWAVTRPVGPAARRLPGRLHLPVLLVVALCSAPLWETLRIGQINTFVGLCLYLSYYCSAQRPWTAGFALAMAIVFKLSPAVFILYFLAVSEHRTAIASLVWVAALTAIAAIQFSPATVMSYLAILPRLSTEIHASVYNESLLGVAVRFLEHLSQYQLVPPATLLHKGIFAALVALLLVTARATRDQSLHRDTRLHLFSALIVATVVFSPLVWYHHSLLLLLPIATLLFHSVRSYVVAGVIVLFLIQANRAFEYSVMQAPVPVVIAHLVLLTASVLAYLQARLLEVRSAPPTVKAAAALGASPAQFGN